MGMMDSMIEQAVSNTLGKANPQMATALNDLVKQHGGLTGVVEKFRSGGMKETVDSWISTGKNLPIDANQINQVLGHEKVRELAAKAGVNPDTLAQNISEYLPQVVDKLTPNGQVPTVGGIMGGLSGLVKNFLGGKQ